MQGRLIRPSFTEMIPKVSVLLFIGESLKMVKTNMFHIFQNVIKQEAKKNWPAPT
jgi:hypothetical protein